MYQVANTEISPFWLIQTTEEMVLILSLLVQATKLTFFMGEPFSLTNTGVAMECKNGRCPTSIIVEMQVPLLDASSVNPVCKLFPFSPPQAEERSGVNVSPPGFLLYIPPGGAAPGPRSGNFVHRVSEQREHDD
jgi:hypothetical protein